MLRLTANFWRRRRFRWYSNQNPTDRRRKMYQLLLLLLFLAATNSLAMVIFEGLPLGDAVWLTLTTMTTVGYGDFSAQTVMGRLVTILLMFFLGIFLLAQIAGEWIDFRIARREGMRKGLWRWDMKDHIVIINTPEVNGARYLRILVEQIRSTPQLRDYPIEILSANFDDGLPVDITAMDVVLHHGVPEGRTDLADVDVQLAKYIVVMAVNTADYRSDSLTLDILDQLRSLDVSGYVVAECVQESNRTRLKSYGANAVIRPVRAYPELMVRALAAPGTEAILEDLFQHAGNHTRRYDIEFEDKTWGAMASSLLLKGLGTPMGYLDKNNEIITNPPPEMQISGSAIFVIASQDSNPKPGEVADCIA